MYKWCLDEFEHTRAKLNTQESGPTRKQGLWERTPLNLSPWAHSLKLVALAGSVPERGEVCSQLRPHNGLLSAAHSSLNRPRSRLLSPRPPRARCREVCIWTGGRACVAGSRDCRCLMDQERLGRRHGDPHPPLLLSRVCFLRAVLMVLSPENMK